MSRAAQDAMRQPLLNAKNDEQAQQSDEPEATVSSSASRPIPTPASGSSSPAPFVASSAPSSGRARVGGVDVQQSFPRLSPTTSASKPDVTLSPFSPAESPISYASFSGGSEVREISLESGPPFRSLQQVSVAPALTQHTGYGTVLPSPRGEFGLPNRSASPGNLSGEPVTVHTPQDWTMFIVGLRLGAMLLLLFWVIWDCLIDTRIHENAADSGFWIEGVLPIYRATGFLIMGYWLWGVCVWVWGRHRIGHLFLMELHPRTSKSHRQVFDSCITLSIVFLVNFLIYFKMQRGDFPKWGVPAGVLPMFMFLLIVVIMVPWPFGWGTPSKQWPRALGQTLLAPLFEVRFIHIFVGDVLTSMVKTLVDLAYSCCFLFTGLWLKEDLTSENGSVCILSPVLVHYITPILSALPLYLRLMQCFRRYYDSGERFPHMVNAGKYATAQGMVLFAVWHASYNKDSDGIHVAWVCSLAFSTLYAYTWDVLMDWDLGSKYHKGLRADLLYRGHWKYYVAICLDLFFRFAWALQFVPPSVASPLGAWFTQGLNPLVTAMEMVRRACWAFFRVENEHLQVVVYHVRKVDEEQERRLALGQAGGEIEAENSVSGSGEYSEAELRAARMRGTRSTTTGITLLLEITALAAAVLAVALISYFTG